MLDTKNHRQKGKTKRLTVCLPADHFVFSLPERQRSAVLKDLLEAGNQILSIREELAGIKEKLNGLYSLLSAGTAGKSGPAPEPVPAEKEEKTDWQKTVDELLKYFE